MTTKAKVTLDQAVRELFAMAGRIQLEMGWEYQEVRAFCAASRSRPDLCRLMDRAAPERLKIILNQIDKEKRLRVRSQAA